MRNKCLMSLIDRMVLRDTYDLITVKSGRMIYIHIKNVDAELHRGYKISKPIIIAKHISLRGLILYLGAIMDQICKIHVHTEFHYDTDVLNPLISVNMNF